MGQIASTIRQDQSRGSESQLEIEEDDGMAESELYKKGAPMRSQLMGDAAVERSAREIYSDPVMKKFIDAATETVFGALWTRPGLDLKTRALICVISDT